MNVVVVGELRTDELLIRFFEEHYRTLERCAGVAGFSMQSEVRGQQNVPEW